jgi:N-acetylglucosaminyldiphosphoundecaprenol N-acetyl-beta-D-mannosaminyltransferase
MVRIRPRMGHVPMDPVTLTQAIERIVDLARSGQGGTVFTPNADHIVVAHENPEFRRAYEQVSLSLVDGTPVFWLSKLLRLNLPEKVSGSDLFEPLVARAAREQLSIYLLGGGPGVGELAAKNLIEKSPGLRVVGLGAPKMTAAGELDDETAWIEKIRRTSPSLVFVACGAPKSELFSARCRHLLAPAVLVCVGASIDFAAGTMKRAPEWISKVGLEWAYRLLKEPRRLAYRYLVRDPKFVWLTLRSAGRHRATLPPPE